MWNINPVCNVLVPRSFELMRCSFQCRYHGWQYDDRGKLVKAPKFENSPGFRTEENGLFEIKLVLTRDGLIYVNFDATTMRMPFDNVESGLDMKAYKWLHGKLVPIEANWKTIGRYREVKRLMTDIVTANDFLSQAHWSRIRFGWVLPRKSKAVRLLSPLSIAKDLDDQVWGTMTLLPTSASNSAVRIDVYSKPGHNVSLQVAAKWEWMLEQEVNVFGSIDERSDLRSTSFSYECGGQ